MSKPHPLEQVAAQIIARFEPLRRDLVRTAVVINEAAKPLHAAIVASVARIEAQMKQREQQ